MIDKSYLDNSLFPEMIMKFREFHLDVTYHQEENGLPNEFSIGHYYDEKKDTYRIYCFFNDTGSPFYYDLIEPMNKLIDNKFINELIGIISLKLHCAEYIKDRPELIKDKYVNRDIRKLITNEINDLMCNNALNNR